MQDVHALICHKDIDMALMCLGSLQKYSLDPVRFVFHDDGSLTEEDEDRLLQEFSSSEIMWKNDADDYMYTSLVNYPNCMKFRSENVLALKLFDVPLFSGSNIAYSDTDILFFKPFNSLFEFDDDNTSCLFMKDYQEAYSLYPWQLIGPGKINLVSRVNTGLFCIRKEIFDLDYIEWLLTNIEFRPIKHWIEQTCWALLASRSECRHWNPAQLIVIKDNTEIFSDLVAGHFARSVRYRLDQFINNDNNYNKDDAVRITTIKSRRCTAFSIALERVKARFIRILNNN